MGWLPGIRSIPARAGASPRCLRPRPVLGTVSLLSQERNSHIELHRADFRYIGPRRVVGSPVFSYWVGVISSGLPHWPRGQFSVFARTCMVKISGLDTKNRSIRPDFGSRSSYFSRDHRRYGTFRIGQVIRSMRPTVAALNRPSYVAFAHRAIKFCSDSLSTPRVKNSIQLGLTKKLTSVNGERGLQTSTEILEFRI